VDSGIIKNICCTLKCNPNDINGISVINAGLTNVSFKFVVDEIEYVYRHPGGTAGNLINRTAEIFSQFTAKSLDIDKSVITTTLSGWKISYCVQNLVDCDFRKYPWQLEKGMELLRLIHSANVTSESIKKKFFDIAESMHMPENEKRIYETTILNAKDGRIVKNFDNVKEAIKLMQIASATKGNLLAEFADEIAKVKELDELVKADAKRLGYMRVCCHNDVYEPNFLATVDGDLYLIDWEYTGLNYAANDIACFFSRYMYSDEDINRFLKAYFQRELTDDEHRFYMAFIPLCAFYWIGWGLYKGSVGDDDGFFFLQAYRNFQRFIDVALDSYRK
jgi:thiamine kinase-like enzyme